MQSSRQNTVIQNYRHAKSRKYKAKQKVHMGYVENRLERSHSEELLPLNSQDKIKIGTINEKRTFTLSPHADTRD